MGFPGERLSVGLKGGEKCFSNQSTYCFCSPPNSSSELTYDLEYKDCQSGPVADSANIYVLYHLWSTFAKVNPINPLYLMSSLHEILRTDKVKHHYKKTNKSRIQDQHPECRTLCKTISLTSLKVNVRKRRGGLFNIKKQTKELNAMQDLIWLDPNSLKEKSYRR